MVAERQQILDELGALIERARGLEEQSLRAEMSARIAAWGAGEVAVPVTEEWHGIRGRSPQILALREQLPKLAAVDAPVLIRGPSGTGKDLVAEIVHRLSPRSDKVLVKENCAAIPESLIESVLFGHVRGAFTGAHRDHSGHFLAADGGTLFLDEVADMSPQMQAKLLRVLQEGEVRAVGSERVRKVDVRVVAATNRDLEEMVASGAFRQDLFYRLAVLTVALPPLAERGSDRVELARYFLHRASEKAGAALEFSPDAERAVAAYSWPGNIRQLINETQRLAVLVDGDIVEVEDLSPQIKEASRGGTAS